MTELACDEVRALAAELALGVLPGRERAAALAHIAGCAGCRDEVDSMAGVADALLLMAPEAEPPAGFESRVLARVAAARPPVAARRRSWALMAVAAVVALVLGLAAGLVAGSDAGRRGGQSASAVMASNVAGWEGTVVAVPIAGHPAQTQLYVSATATRQYGTYIIEVVDRDGGLHRFAGVDLTDGKVVWSRTLSEPAANLTTIRMVTPDGTVLCHATLRT
jgi:anti-sigma-K factor RskA